MTPSALVPIASGSEEIEAVCIIDVLRRADVAVTVASVETDLQVTAARGTKLVAERRLADCTGTTWDLIALPGGTEGAEHLRDCAELIPLLREQISAGRLCGAICAAPALVLAHHGLLAGRNATCHPGFVELLAGRPGLEHRVVVDRPIVTSRGPGTALEFALKLVELLCGQEKAAAVAAHMVMPQAAGA
jgi:4-methyl-5(b-hydroxyethyl)-thiazole monophosphate biosynthesis